MLDLEFERIGKRLFLEGLVGANFGNMSVRAKAGFYITRSGAYLDDREMPVFVPGDGEAPPEASSEYRVHRAVYRISPHLAIVHAHPVHAVAASLDTDLIRPVDSEGRMLCPEIPVVGGEPGTDEIAQNVSRALRGGHIVIVRGHGTFAAGATLDVAYIYTSIAEYACRVLFLSGRFRRVM
ncbi:MAG TPA: aldolase [Candidatus Methanoculleus thermohydrogenotrophicum]|nr:aldolase [Candidatus Methanoculleus thermohydrogenotrophicum]NLM82293.1 aldolase [Candidatus Methanoculleus thermohydrogenotrophicum]HOB18907.1 aldolase [Candidatus Methanoculleus thermohydrogenotrophicum]HPZ38786.1 aldolase [Candidatus Methanoculleus thermohydrogenotrophicum]HQC92056.1 aldolase [Candidatus Methanoculleus thermohydrogenotrophicum]